MQPDVLAERHHSLQNACMVSITIRDVPQEARNELASRAARSGRSLQEYLHGELVALAARPDTATVMARIRERKRVAESTVDVESIRADLDSDRR